MDQQTKRQVVRGVIRFTSGFAMGTLSTTVLMAVIPPQARIFTKVMCHLGGTLLAMKLADDAADHVIEMVEDAERYGDFTDRERTINDIWHQKVV